MAPAFSGVVIIIRRAKLACSLSEVLAGGNTHSMLPHSLTRVAALAALAGLTGAACLVGGELTPSGPGALAVGSTNLEVAPPTAGRMFAYLNGKTTATEGLYLTSILAHREAVPTVEIKVPSDPNLFGRLAGTQLPVVLVIFYPTTGENARPDYNFPYQDTGDRVFPHMQRPGEKPELADPSAKYPLIIFSGGYNTHPLWHLDQLKLLASHGYIVADLCYGDGRVAAFAGNLSLRLMAVTPAIDFLLERSDFAGAIDRARIGMVGQSAGGHTVLAAMGGTDPAGRIPSRPEPRIKAGFGLVPFMGGSIGFWPFSTDAWYFGPEHAGLRAVHAPFLAVYGQKDANVPPDGVEDGVRMLSGPATAVMLDGETHSLSDACRSDICTWELLFFDAWLRDDAGARRQLESGDSVRGGVIDHRTIQHGAR